jgi:ribulose-bisphosphate carboxylase small chain
MIHHGTFAQLPALDDDEIAAQVRYAIAQGWAVSVEHSDDPHPRNMFWDLWGLPLFDLTDPRPALDEIDACRRAFPDHHVKVSAFDSRKGRETIALSFLVQRPDTEVAYALERQHAPGRTTRYALRPVEPPRPPSS